MAHPDNSASEASSHDHSEETGQRVSSTTRRPFTFRTRRRGEVARLLIIVLLFAAFGITLVWAFIGANGPHWNNVKDLLDLLLPAETALIGTAVAFYMTDPGSRDDDK